MVEEKLKSIRLLLLDADGVLTAGQLLYGDAAFELKAFDVKDGLGIRMLKNAGIRVGIVSGRKSLALDRRAAELDIDYCLTGIKDKEAQLESILAQAKCSREQAAFVGDDLPDIAVMGRVGLAVAVADAHEAVKASAHLVTTRPGGRGAVREVCERILQAKGLWEKTLASFTGRA